MIYIFSGPTLRPEAKHATLPDAVFLPPAAHGDVYRVALERPVAIGIIDGYFERVPAIWHKEILWAMQQGIHVYGSASMGALRAAELHPFGMVGVGWIFEQFRTGQFEDDDEVVLVHGEAEVNYLGFSEPMVNIRQTLLQAEKEAIISSTTHQSLVSLAKALFYPDRQYGAILHAGEQAGLNRAELYHLENWLPLHAVDQKKLDAQQMLQVMQTELLTNPTPKTVKYRLEQTEWWSTLQWRAGNVIRQTEQTIETESLLDEVRVEADAFERLHRDTLLHELALREANQQRIDVSEETLQARVDQFRQQNNLTDPEMLQQWLVTNQLTEQHFIQLIDELTKVEIVLHQLYPRFMTGVGNQLRLQNRYAGYAQRATDKHQALSEQGQYTRTVSFRDGTAENAVAWLFERHQKPIPDDLDLYAQRLGLPNAEAFRLLAIRDYYYEKLVTT